MKQLDNYVNLRDEVDAATPSLASSAVATRPPARPFYAFARNARAVRSSIAHFQLRNLLSTPSRTDAYVVHASRLVHWCSATRARSVVVDASGDPGAPPLGAPPPGAIPVSPGRIQVGTAAVSCGLAALGGFNGELVVAGVTRATARARGPRCAPPAPTTASPTRWTLCPARQRVSPAPPPPSWPPTMMALCACLTPPLCTARGRRRSGGPSTVRWLPPPP